MCFPFFSPSCWLKQIVPQDKQQNSLCKEFHPSPHPPRLAPVLGLLTAESLPGFTDCLQDFPTGSPDIQTILKKQVVILSYQGKNEKFHLKWKCISSKRWARNEGETEGLPRGGHSETHFGGFSGFSKCFL